MSTEDKESDASASNLEQGHVQGHVQAQREEGADEQATDTENADELSTASEDTPSDSAASTPSIDGGTESASTEADATQNTTETQVFPLPDEDILQRTNLIQAELGPDALGSEESSLESLEKIQKSLQNLWQDIKIVKVPINSHIALSHISGPELKLIVARLHDIQILRQRRFKKIIDQMQERGEKSGDYSSQIVDEQEGYNYNILFVNFTRYLKSIFHPPTLRILQSGDLLYPQGALMRWAFHSLSGKILAQSKSETQSQNNSKMEKKLEHKAEKNVGAQDIELVNKFDFTVALLSDLDQYFCSIFFVGGDASLLAKVEDIFKTSFSNIKILGRYAANYRKGKEKLLNEIKTVINKSAPTLLLVSEKGHIQDFIGSKPGKKTLKSFLVVDYPEALKDFSGRYRRKKQHFTKIFCSLRYLIFPWLWIKLLCMCIFILKILFLKFGRKGFEKLEQSHGK